MIHNPNPNPGKSIFARLFFIPDKTSSLIIRLIRKQNHPNLTPQIIPLKPVKSNPSYGNLELFLDMDWVRNNEKIGSNRMRFILECLKDLDATLKQMGTRLFVLRGDSTTVIRKFCRG